MDIENNSAFYRAKGDFRRAQKDWPIGTIVQHVNSGNVYEIVGHAIRELNLEVLLLYTRTDDPVWSRPAQEFGEYVEYDDPNHPDLNPLGPRFIVLEPET